MKSKIITLTAGLALLIGNAIFAQEIKWTGAGDGVYWEDDANWDGTFRPTDTDWALFDSSGTTVALNSTAGVGGMIFSSGGWNFSGGNLNLG
ncbi:MAG: hypothetical protein LBD30_08190, partial [Verrucomicrobiales bacterium]|nr:hypothetical protein [Verrucomicrobiales bacterium]